MRIEQQFRAELDKLIAKYLRIPDFATLGQITAALVQFSTMQQSIEAAGASLASRMWVGVDVANQRSWREAARKSMRGRHVSESLRTNLHSMERRRRQLIAENAQMIGSIPETLRERAANKIAKLQMDGKRADEIAEELRAIIPGMAKSKSQLIAFTETSKAATAITRVRSEDLGLNWYAWETSRDARVRESHKLMHGVLVNWNDPPSPERLAGEKHAPAPYHAGNIWRCRCDNLPILDMNQVSWPHKVFTGGKIRMMTRHAFSQIAGREVAGALTA